MKNISITIPTLSNGGAERVVSNISLNLPDDINNNIFLYRDEITYDYKGKIDFIHSIESNNFFRKIIASIQRIINLRKLKKKNNINKSISFLTNPNVINILSKVDEEIILSVRNYKSKQVNGLNGTIYKYLMRLLYNRADKLIAVSEIIKHDLINNFNIDEDKIHVINNPYDIEKIGRLSAEEVGIKHKEIFENPTIITVGSLTEQKGHWNLIKAISELKNDIPNIQLVILGKGELENKLVKLSEDLGVADRIHFLGFVDNPFKYVKNADIFVFPSLYEGFPNALVEAMACGTPVISTDCKSGPREILAPDTDIFKSVDEIEYEKYGILVPVRDNVKVLEGDNFNEEIDGLVHSIKELLVNDNLRQEYSELAKERVEDFKIDLIMEEWVNLIK